MTPRRALIVNPYGIGDVLFTLPLVQALREARPDVVIGYLCNRRAESLVRAFPGVATVRVFEKDELRALWTHSTHRWIAAVCALARALRADRWDTAFDLSLNWEFGAALAAVGIRRRIGFDYRRRGWCLTNRLPLTGFDDRPVADYYLDLLAPLGIPRPAHPAIALPVPPIIAPEVSAWLARAGASPTQPLIGVAPGGGASWGSNGAAKRWPVAAFAEVADRLQAALDGQIVLFGDQADRALCEAVAARLSRPAVIAPPAPSLLVLAGGLQRCRFVLGNDSGVLHLAAAVGTPSLAIFGPASPIVYGPYPSAGSDDRHRIAVKPLACRPCYARFRLPPCPWDHRCLTALTPDEVYAAAEPLLAA